MKVCFYDDHNRSQDSYLSPLSLYSPLSHSLFLSLTLSFSLSLSLTHAHSDAKLSDRIAQDENEAVRAAECVLCAEATAAVPAR